MPVELRRPSPSGHQTLATHHLLVRGDARELGWLPDESVHLIVTSPPYWTLKQYRRHPAQLGAVGDYQEFHDQLSRVWRHAYSSIHCTSRCGA